ncbi:hypothetical protein D9758_003483 [Tetrapyrgos nigripes]|uniref:Flavin-containing monooxygenase n=1 Tax=Tetrapyrgos nigripes TaxID=182062 RepID=A0A8H5LW32_9AGAR|nr:hypothetical protein D9758_003483 [Tetrapyrgos nigripes]
MTLVLLISNTNRIDDSLNSGLEDSQEPKIDLKDLRETKKICVIGGGGPAGLAALKSILSSPRVKSGLWTVVAYEAREGIGGVWLPSPSTPPASYPELHPGLPQTPLYTSLTTNLPHPVMQFTSFPFSPETPLFPKAEYVRRYLEEYVDNFGLRKFVQVNTRVERVERAVQSNEGVLKGGDGREWKIVTRSRDQDHVEMQYFDFLVICNGHYQIPRYPDPETPGLQQWLNKGKAIHSIYYRDPEILFEWIHTRNSNSSLSLTISTSNCNSDFSLDNSSSSEGKEPKSKANGSWPTEKRGRGLRLVVVGSGPSGSDISAELAERVEVDNVFWSVSGGAEGAGAGSHTEAKEANGDHTDPTDTAPGVNTPSSIAVFNALNSTPMPASTVTSSKPKSKIHKRGRIIQFLPSSNGDSILFEENVIDKDIDLVILATGYKVDLPFFQDSDEVITKEGMPPAPFNLSGSASASTSSISTSASPSLVKKAKTTSTAATPTPLFWNSTYHIYPLARHIFPLSLPPSPYPYTPQSPDQSSPPLSFTPTPSPQTSFKPTPPTLAFLGLPTKVAPFPLLEAQAQVVVTVFANAGSDNPAVWDYKREWKQVMDKYEKLRRGVEAQLGVGRNDDRIERRQVDRDIEERIEKAISKSWHKFDVQEQFDYRDELYLWASTSFPTSSFSACTPILPDVAVEAVKVPEWEKKMYDAKTTLRAFWVDLEKNGKGREWIREVASVANGDRERGKEQWVRLMERMLKRQQAEKGLHAEGG